MSRSVVLVCDNCKSWVIIGRIEHDGMVSSGATEIQAWGSYMTVLYEATRTEEGQEVRDAHFCSDRCLVSWAEKRSKK